MNWIGPRTDPWGTVIVQVVSSDPCRCLSNMSWTSSNELDPTQPQEHCTVILPETIDCRELWTSVYALTGATETRMLLIRRLKTGCTEWTVNSHGRQCQIQSWGPGGWVPWAALCRLLEWYHCERWAWLPVSNDVSNDGAGKPAVWMETSYCVHSVQQNVLRHISQPVWIWMKGWRLVGRS